MVVHIRDLLIRYPGYRHRPALGYLWAVVFVSIGLVVRFAADDYLLKAPSVTFYPAVLLATLVGGRGPGLLAAIGSGTAAHYFILNDRSFAFAGWPQTLTVVLYVLVAVVIVLLMDWLIKIAEQNAVLAKRTEALLTELQHRVKNHIQIVSSLLNLQARRAEGQTSTALADVARRINMISSAYSHLYRADMQMDFATHLHDIADAALSGKRTQRSIDVSCGPTMWGMDFVMPVSLIASELIDNALRHGLTDGQGRVDVSLAREGDKYVLRVSDGGGRLPEGFDASRNTGLGLQLATAMTKRLRGTLRAERTPRTTFVVEFPA